MAVRGRRQREPMERLVRLLAVLSAAGERGLRSSQLLQVAGFGPDAKDPGTQLAKEFRLLRQQGWQIDSIGLSGEEGRYRLVKGDNRLRLSLTPGQLAALQRAALLADRDDLVDKLGLGEADRPAEVSLGPHDTDLAQVMAAVQGRALVRFRYKGTSRAVHPGGLINQNGSWYLHGVEDDAEVAKSFVLPRMSEIEVDEPGTAHEVPAVRRLNLHPMRWEIDPPVEVELEVPRDYVPDVVRWLAEPQSTATDVDHPDGGAVRMTYRVTNRAGFRSRIYMLGARARIISPSEVLDEVIAELEEMS
ncbi:MAG: WYL domain-containing protein [Nocardioides sp.]